MKDVDVEDMDDDSERKLFEARHLLDASSKIGTGVKSGIYRIDNEKLKREVEEELRREMLGESDA